MYKNVLAKIIREVQAKNAPTDFPVKFIAIDGHGGSGKSTLADELSAEIGAEIIHTDDFASWNHQGWKRLLDEIFLPIKGGAKRLSYPRSSWGPDHHPKPVKDQKVTPIM